jgi:hypothetical protein
MVSHGAEFSVWFFCFDAGYWTEGAAGLSMPRALIVENGLHAHSAEIGARELTAILPADQTPDYLPDYLTVTIADARAAVASLLAEVHA